MADSGATAGSTCAEIHVINGTKNQTNAQVLPQTLRQRIPLAEWMEKPEAWDKKKFIQETADFLFDVYGIGDNLNKHTLGMLADQMDIYINAGLQLKTEDLVLITNGGKTAAPNPLITIRNKATTLIIQLMNELGLTPRSRLSTNKSNDSSPIDDLLKGAKAL